MLGNKKQLKNSWSKKEVKKLKSCSPQVFLPVFSEVSVGFGRICGGCIGLETTIEQKLFKSS